MRQRYRFVSLLVKIVSLAFIFVAGIFISASIAEEMASVTAPTPPVAPQPSPEFLIPPSVKQGEVLRIIVDDPTGELDKGSVWLAGKQVRLYPDAQPGKLYGLMPVSIFQKAGGYGIKVQDVNGKTLYTGKVEVTDARYPVQNLSISSSTQGLQPLPGEMEAIQGLKDQVSPARLWAEPFVTPTPDCQNSPFGVKRAYNGKISDNYHKGVDLRSPAGRPIQATADGKVQIARMYRLHGGTVGLDHGQGVSSVYIHMSKLAVQEGQQVKKGDTIGYVGSTGFATGPHLHWGLYVNGMPVNPNQFIQGVPRC